MITNFYTKPVPINAIVASAAKEIFTLLLQRQSDIAEMDYNHHSTPYLYEVLQPSLAEVTFGEDNVDIQVNYPITIRFLDLRKRFTGKYKFVKGVEKKIYRKRSHYVPIYNRLLYGHVYGKGYSLSNVINAQLHREYENYSQNLKNVMEFTML